MSVRIRVYPQGAAGGYNTYALQNATLRQQLANQQKLDSLRLAYERQLAAQQLQMATLKAQVQYGTLGTGQVIAGVSPATQASYMSMLPYLGMFQSMSGGAGGLFGGLGLGSLFGF